VTELAHRSAFSPSLEVRAGASSRNRAASRSCFASRSRSAWRSRAISWWD